MPYDQVTEQLIYRRGSKRPRSLDEVSHDDLQVIAGSSHEETLRQQRATGFPKLSWQRRRRHRYRASAVRPGPGR